MDALFGVQDLTVRFGGVTAVDGVSATVDEGQFVGLIGPNGAGKTTFIDAVTGFVPATGAIALRRRRDHRRWPAHQRAAPGSSGRCSPSSCSRT